MSIKTNKTWLVAGMTLALASGAPGFVAPSLMQTAVAQTQKVTGTVVDEFGDPIIGANIRVKGTTTGAVTDIDGKFSLDAKPGADLEVSFIGYASQSVKAANGMTITLREDSQSLDDVVVVGYGTQKKKLVTGATVQVKGDDLAKLNSTNALGAMASSTPGVQITQSSSQPGSDFKVYIRGIGTTGDSAPLVVVDGIAGGSLSTINPADIESIDVLKDAASAAIYGARAANGVILVTTKQGKVGKVEVSYNMYAGWSNVYRRPQLLNAQDYMTILDEYNYNVNQSPVDWASKVPAELLSKYQNGGAGTDWWDFFKNENALQQNHAVSITGGSDRSKFALSYTYTGNEGIMGRDLASNYQRTTLRLNSEHVVLKVGDRNVITVGENLSFNTTKNHSMAEGSIYWNFTHALLTASPLVPIYQEDGKNYTYNNNKEGWDPVIFNNPWEFISNGGYGAINQHRNMGIGATAYIEISPINGLKIRSQYNHGWSAYSGREYSQPYSHALQGANDQYSVSQNMNMGGSFAVENTITYDLPVIAKNKITILAGQSFQGSDWGLGMGGSNKTNEAGKQSTLSGWNAAYLSNIAGNAQASLSGSPWDENYIASWFGRASWDYNETYMATVTVRADGSSKFAKGNRWGIFPSASAGWVLTNENFMEGTKSWLDFFKIRGSWGQNGNQSVDAYQYLATIAYSGQYYDNGYKFDSTMDGSTAAAPHSGAYANVLPNPDITWETSEQLDFGFDARLLDSRLGINFDWYKKTTKDWLVQAPSKMIYGTTAPFINGGDVENTGFELALSWNDRIGKDFRYNIGVNMATNKNEVTRIANANGYMNGAIKVLSEQTDYMYRAEVGKPIGYFYGMGYEGIWQNQAQIDAARAAGKAVLPDAQPGDMIWEDYNGDGVINGDSDVEGTTDRHMIGNPNPDFTLGVNLSMQWKGLDFAVNGAGAFGQQIMKSYRSFVDSPYQNYDATVFDRWHGEGTSNTQPRLCAGTHTNNKWISGRYMEDGDYFKIKTVTLGYDFKSIWKKCPLQQFRLYVQAQNLYTFTGYSGCDPEIGSSGGNQGWASGVDLGLYPSSRTWVVGASVKF